MKSCDKCGADNGDNADFCNLCMAPFAQTGDLTGQTPAPGAPRPPGNANQSPTTPESEF